MKTTVSKDSTPFALMKKYLEQQQHQEIFYSEDQNELEVKKEEQEFDPPKTEESEDSIKKLRLQSYGDLFADYQNKDPETDSNQRVNSYEDDFYLPEEPDESSSFDVQIQVDSDLNFDETKRPKPSKSRKSSRKIRTIITKEKLHQINIIFKEYLEKKGNGDMSMTNLKQIGQLLGLGYSTILHKYKEFKQNKEVKGGYLLQIQGSKRKYSKSVLVEQHIRQALQKVELANAVEISKHIFKTKGIYYSRAVVCRHLLAMKRQKEIINIPSIGSQNLPNTSEKNMKEVEVKTFQQILESEKKKGNIVYCHEIVFSFQEFPQNATEDDLIKLNRKRGDCLSLTLVVAINSNQVIYQTIRRGFLLKEQYVEVLASLANAITVNKSQKSELTWLVSNKNQIHYHCNKKIQEQAEQILKNHGIQSIFLQPQVLNLSSLQTLFLNIKEKLKTEPKKYQSLKKCIQREVKNWIEEGLNFQF